MALIGALLRAVWEYFRRHRGVSVAQMLLTAIILSVPMLLRGGISDTIARYLFMLLPLVIAARLCWSPTTFKAKERSAALPRASRSRAT